MNASSISANLNNIPTLTGSNFAKWKEHVSIVLGCMDLDYALRVDEALITVQLRKNLFMKSGSVLTV